MIRRPGQSIPPSGSFPGLLSYDFGEGREIVVIGHGEEVEMVLQRAVQASADREANQ